MSNQEIEPNQKLKTSEQLKVVQPESTTKMQAAYGDKFQDHLMEQYKMCVEMADRVSVRRSQANSFYISLLSALIALLSLVIDKQLFSGSKNVLLLFTSGLGLALCFAWYTNIQSYKQLNSLKFRVIHEMEQYLPFHSFTREWEILKEQKESRKEYTRLTTTEKFVPLVFAVPYLGLFVYSFLSVFSIIK